jgi:hypothetical protein
MKKTIAILFVALAVTSCNNSNSYSAPENPASVDNPENTKTPEELKAELGEQEKSDPLTYLKVEATMSEDQVQTRNEGLFHSAEYSPDGNTIRGTITNSATIAKFKDAVVTVTFYSQTKTAIETKDYIMYEFYAPNSTKNFELKVYPPETMVKFGIEITGATAAE